MQALRRVCAGAGLLQPLVVRVMQLAAACAVAGRAGRASRSARLARRFGHEGHGRVVKFTDAELARMQRQSCTGKTNFERLVHIVRCVVKGIPPDAANADSQAIRFGSASARPGRSSGISASSQAPCWTGSIFTFRCLELRSRS